MDFVNLATTIWYICLLVIFTYALKSWINIRKFSAVPGPRPRLPLIGTNWFFFGRNLPRSEVMNAAMTDLRDTYKKDGYCAMFNSDKLVVCLFDPKYAIDFLKDNKLINKADDYAYFKIWLGDSLVTGNGNIWKNKRKLLNPTFHTNVLDNYIPSMNIQCEALIKELTKASKSDAIDVRSLMSDTTLNIIAMTAMGITLDKGSIEIEQYRECIHTLPTTIVSRVHNPLKWYDFLFFRQESGKKLRKDIDIVNNFHRKVLEKRRSEFTLGFDTKRKQMAFLDLLLTLQSEDKKITDEEILYDVSTFLFAGHDTSSVCLTYTLYLLGKNPKAQQQLIEEMQSIFGDDRQRHVNKDDISRMHYTDCVIKESLRMYSPIPQVGRKASEDFYIANHCFPRGTSVFVFLKDIHRNEKLFPNPNEFIPERFEISNELQMAFIPFAIGPRNCIGQRFAMIEMKCVLAHIFRNFTVKTLNKGDQLKVTSDVVYKPMEPINVQFKSI